MRISILIPCYNEELTIEKSLMSCINQTRHVDEIIVINDSSTDNTPIILERFRQMFPEIKVVKTLKNTGNKSYAQEIGISHITGDFFVTTDGDTILDKDFIKNLEKDMENPAVAAASGYVKSHKKNWLTACRAFDYIIGQNIDKLAQYYLNSIFIIPGAAGAFRTEIFKKEIRFDHDTITEDLDFTFRFHELGYKIAYNMKAICYTQDPFTVKSYINQMRRWLGGGWQNLLKHWQIPKKPGMALELSLIYIEGLAYSILMFAMPLINFHLALILWQIYFGIILGFGLYAALKEKRPEFLFIFPIYFFLKYVSAWIFLEQFFKEIIIRKKNLVWFKPDRIEI